MTTEPPEDFEAFLKEQVYKAFYPNGMTPEEQELDEAYGRLQAAEDAEDEAYREAMRVRMRYLAEQMPELMREQGYDIPEDLHFVWEES
jgi:hypothetical protein